MNQVRLNLNLKKEDMRFAFEELRSKYDEHLDLLGMETDTTDDQVRQLHDILWNMGELLGYQESELTEMLNEMNPLYQEAEAEEAESNDQE